MHMSRIRARAVFASTFAALLFGLAPAAAAQGLFPLVIRPLEYRVSLPALGWNISTENNMVTVGRDDVVIIVSATDLVAWQENTLTGPEADQRRILTQRFTGSDSIMMALMTRVVARLVTLEQEGLVQEVRTLGAQRAAYIGGRDVRDGEARWAQAYITVKDGIMYMLFFFVQHRNPDRHKDLFDRVHQSFVLAEAPPS